MHQSGLSLKLVVTATTFLCGFAGLVYAQSNFGQSAFAPKTPAAAGPSGATVPVPPMAASPHKDLTPTSPAAPDALKPVELPKPGMAAMVEPLAAPPKDSFGKPEEEASPLADLPPALPEASEIADVPPIPKLPDVLPQPSEPEDVAVVRVNTPVESLPEPKPEKTQVKTWLTKLEPAIRPPETRFNYRRDILPSPIYRTGYDERNLHLPRLTTRQHYENLLFASAMRNDVETTRALLNAGTNINVVASTGETPLAAARRTGAQATAALLMARGGQ